MRPVAADTDVGVDLYCETVDEDAIEDSDDSPSHLKTPFLHFWVQVKTGKQCKVTVKDGVASCYFEIRHLRYWRQQPVPVFAALIPGDWPMDDHPTIYIVDISSRLLRDKKLDSELDGQVSGKAKRKLVSDCTWEHGNSPAVQSFVAETVPVVTAQMQCRFGVVARVPTIRPGYLFQVPEIPIQRFSSDILKQLRRTAAFSILQLYGNRGFSIGIAEDRRLLASIVEQFGDDQHWENFASRALSLHADQKYIEAKDLYEKSITCIASDTKFGTRGLRNKMISDLTRFLNAADAAQPLNTIEI